MRTIGEVEYRGGKQRGARDDMAGSYPGGVPARPDVSERPVRGLQLHARLAIRSRAGAPVRGPLRRSEADPMTTADVRQRVMDRARWMPCRTVKARSWTERRACRLLEARGVLRRTSVPDVWRLA